MNFRINWISNLRLCSSSNVLTCILTFVRFLYIGVAICFVCFGYYETMLIAKQGNRHVKEEVTVLSKYRYPSITFCYVFKHGGKDVWSLYFRHFIEKWKQSGNWNAINLHGRYIHINKY